MGGEGLLHCQSGREHSGEEGKTGQGVPGEGHGGLAQRAGEAAGRPWPIQREAGPSTPCPEPGVRATGNLR